MDECRCRGHVVKTCIVMRHLSPTDEDVIEDGATEGNYDDNEFTLGKRPYRKLKVREIHLDFSVIYESHWLPRWETSLC